MLTRALRTDTDQRALRAMSRDGSGVERIQPGYRRSHAPDPSPTDDDILAPFGTVKPDEARHVAIY